MSFSPYSFERPIPRFALSSHDIPALKAQFDVSGVVVLGPPSLNPQIFDEMLYEARQQRGSAWLCERSGNDGQSCAQRNWRAELGPVSRALLSSKESEWILYQITETHFEPSFEASCFTYYESSFDFLSLHQDRPGS